MELRASYLLLPVTHPLCFVPNCYVSTLIKTVPNFGNQELIEVKLYFFTYRSAKFEARTVMFNHTVSFIT